MNDLFVIPLNADKEIKYFLYNYKNISKVYENRKNDLIDSINVSNRSWLNSLNSEYGNTLENILIKFENDRTLKRIELWKKIINSFISNLYDLEDKNYYYVIKYSYIDNLETEFILERLNLSLQELKEVKRELRYKIYQKALELKLFKEVINIEQYKSNFYS